MINFYIASYILLQGSASLVKERGFESLFKTPSTFCYCINITDQLFNSLYYHTINTLQYYYNLFIPRKYTINFEDWDLN